MYPDRSSNHRLFLDRQSGDDRQPAPPRHRMLTFRDRVARGYYDRPDLTEAAVVRMLQILNGQNN